MKPYPHYIIDTARELRQRETKAENWLWDKLRKRQLDGLKFRRQHHIGRYVADFYCAELRLVVEVEGKIHTKPDQRAYDEERFGEIVASGLKVLRISNEEILKDIGSVLNKIRGVRRVVTGSRELSLDL